MHYRLLINKNGIVKRIEEISWKLSNRVQLEVKDEISN